MNKLKAFSAILITVLILVMACTSKSTDPTPAANTSSKTNTSNGSNTNTATGKTTDTTKTKILLNTNWVGTDDHYIYGNFDDTYDVTVNIKTTATTDEYQFVINYLLNPPKDRTSPNMWNCKIVPIQDSLFTVVVSSTYRLDVQIFKNGRAHINSNNGDEVMVLNKK